MNQNGEPDVLEIKVISTKACASCDKTGDGNEVLFSGNSLLIPCGGSSCLEVCIPAYRLRICFFPCGLLQVHSDVVWLGRGASTPWKEGDDSKGLLEWFAWSEAAEITIEELP